MRTKDTATPGLLEALAHLTARVEAIEAKEPGHEHAPTQGSPDRGTFWALDGLKQRLTDHPSTADGAVLLTGAVTLPTGEPVEWQQGAGSTGLLESDWTDLAPTLSALSHPVRLELLRQVLLGVRTTAALAEVGTLSSTGQLHHHLRQLVSGGWLRQSGRGSYEVPATRVVPLLVTLTAVQR